MTILLLISKGEILVVVVVLQFGWIALLTGRNKLHFKNTFYNNEERIELNTNHLPVCIGGMVVEEIRCHQQQKISYIILSAE